MKNNISPAGNSFAKFCIMSVFLWIVIHSCSPVSLAASAEKSAYTAYSINLNLLYGITALVSFGLALGYRFVSKNREKWLMLLLVAVAVVNTGYYCLAASQNLNQALWANRLSYLGSVFLPICMLMSVAGVCKIELNRKAVICALSVGCLIFLVAASPGWLDIYYKQVSFVVENGTARLLKGYGEFHVLYLIYLVVYFALMVGFVVYAVVRKKLSSYKYAAMLATVVLLNLLIWFLEQIIDTDFEFLSISYIVSELLLLFIYSMLNDHSKLNRSLEIVTAQAEKKVQESEIKEPLYTAEEIEKAISELNLTENLTTREQEVLKLTLSGKKRKSVADELCVSENTVKTHLSHIFAKTGVSSKKELADKLFSIQEQI